MKRISLKKGWISACSAQPPHHHPVHLWALDRHFSRQLSTSKPASHPAEGKQQHPWVLIAASEVGRFELFWCTTPLQVQRGKTRNISTPVGNNTHTLRYTKSEPGSWETHRGGRTPKKHSPRLVGSITFSGLSCLPHLPDMMEREGGEEERGSHDVRNKHKYYWCLKPENHRKYKYSKFSFKSHYSNYHGGGITCRLLQQVTC